MYFMYNIIELFTETFVDISSSSFNVSKSAGILVVTLVSLKALSQSFIVGIIAEADNSSVFPAATGMYLCIYDII